ncbi:hypothetical protein ONZ45_g9544 [Pleurotus djamor]|nr:hypothetical protein ONZ45_g9544 [Pleurotus djamor]
MRVYTDHAAQAAIDKRIQTLLRQRNTYAAISKLPNETMAHIFNTCRAQSLTTHAATRVLLSLLAICSHWRHIALDSAPLWARISLDQAPSWATAMVRMSKNAPLSVECSQWTYYGNPRVFAILNILAAETHRLENLTLHAGRPDISSLVSRFLPPNGDSRAPLLRSLVVEAHPPGNHGLEPPLFRFWTDLRSLRTLRLRDFLPADVAIPHMPVLTELKVFAERTGHRLSISWVANILRQTPLIEHVEIGIISSPNTTTMTVPCPIHLPHLSRLMVVFEYLQASKLLTYLKLPPSTHVYLRFRNEEEDPTLQMGIGGTLNRDPPTQALEHFLSYIILPNIELLNVCVMGNNRGSGADYQLNFRHSTDTHPMPGMKFVIERFPSSARQHINLAELLPLTKILDLTLFGLEDNDIPAWLHILPSLIHLESICINRVNSLPILATLAPIPSESDYASHSDSLCLPNPDLASIWLYEDRTSPNTMGAMLDQVIQVCERRNECGGPRLLVSIHSPHVIYEYLEPLEECAELEWDVAG